MKRSFGLFFAALFLALFGVAGSAFAQWGQNAPRDGACFYKDGYGSESFCLNAGQSVDRMPPGFNDQITSMRLFGRARVVVFENSNYGGPNETFDRSQSDLRNVRKRDDPSRVWSDRISSIRVEYAEGRADDRWGRDRDDDRWRDRDRDDRWRDRDRDDRWRDRDDRGWHGGNNPNFPVWGRGPQPRQGACFFRDSNWRGDYFCMARGQSLSSMPPGFNDRISSVRLFGGARVFVFQDSNFRGREGRFRRDIADLHDRRLRDDRDRNWNDRISSIQVD
ncbi:MAG TPA: peptidase inhibitor family I36 protein [Terriglobales bacterium]|nr:peptidase inhibitor family I36 protein [Terriglobales bacterium]